MGFRPRHYFLLALIVGLGIFNVLRIRHARKLAQEQSVAVPEVAPLAPAASGSAATWTLFDKAAALRDAPDAEFQPALTKLNAQSDVETSDVSGCKTWLLFYRQGKVHPPVDNSWQSRSTTHLDNCVKLHRDTAQ